MVNETARHLPAVQFQCVQTFRNFLFLSKLRLKICIHVCAANIKRCQNESTRHFVGYTRVSLQATARCLLPTETQQSECVTAKNIY
jgi:hypothetical protein